MTAAPRRRRARGAPAGDRHARPMREAFPRIAEFLRGYLHEDFEIEYGSAPAALRAYLADLSAAEREAFDDERSTLLARVSGTPIARIRRLLADDFGCAWAPATREEVEAVLAARA